VVVAELGVVVVLDDERAGALCPREQGTPATSAENRTRRELVRRSDKGRVALEAVDDEPLLVYGLSHELESARPDPGVLRRMGRILDSDSCGATSGEHAQEHIDALSSPLDDDDLLRLGDHPSRLREVRGERLAQARLASRRAIVKRLVTSSWPTFVDALSHSRRGKRVTSGVVGVRS
jgi:hypothetical protein